MESKGKERIDMERKVKERKGKVRNSTKGKVIHGKKWK